jgi:hypothetical protein
VNITHAAEERQTYQTLLQMIESDVQKSGLETTERANFFPSRKWGFSQEAAAFPFPSLNQPSAFFSPARHLHLTLSLAQRRKKTYLLGEKF